MHFCLDFGLCSKRIWLWYNAIPFILHHSFVYLSVIAMQKDAFLHAQNLSLGYDFCNHSGWGNMSAASFQWTKEGSWWERLHPSFWEWTLILTSEFPFCSCRSLGFRMSPSCISWCSNVPQDPFPFSMLLAFTGSFSYFSHLERGQFFGLICLTTIFSGLVRNSYKSIHYNQFHPINLPFQINISTFFPYIYLMNFLNWKVFQFPKS